MNMLGREMINTVEIAENILNVIDSVNFRKGEKVLIETAEYADVVKQALKNYIAMQSV